MRLFLAIRLPDEVLSRTLEVQSALKDRITRQGVRFTPPHKIHLTLAFLGNDLEPEEADRIARGVDFSNALSLSLGSVGAFPDMNRPKTVWFGVDGEGLGQLAGRLGEAFGLPLSQFVGHVTLARVSPASKAVGRLLRDFAAEAANATWLATEVELIASLPSGEYETLNRYAL